MSFTLSPLLFTVPDEPRFFSRVYVLPLHLSVQFHPDCFFKALSPISFSPVSWAPRLSCGSEVRKFSLENCSQGLIHVQQGPGEIRCENTSAPYSLTFTPTTRHTHCGAWVCATRGPEPGFYAGSSIPRDGQSGFCKLNKWQVPGKSLFEHESSNLFVLAGNFAFYSSE